jgi:hypothetical protein
VSGIGVVSADDATEIEDINDLRNVSDDMSGDYVLVDDIDASDINFEPIGSSGNLFTGTFDGNGYVVSNLTVDRPDEEGVGLFGGTGETSVVQNVGVKDADVTGRRFVGGLVGTNYGVVAESYVTGEVEGEQEVGGLVGYNDEVVTRSYSEADVTGGMATGGLVGLSELSGRPGVEPNPEEVCSPCDVVLTESYAVGEVTSDRNGQSIMGAMSFLGGGRHDYLFKNLYWDAETTGVSDSWEESTGLNTSEMQGESAREHMEGFDFNGTWEVTDGYPRLANRDEPVDVEAIERERNMSEEDLRPSEETNEDDGTEEESGDDTEDEAAMPGFTVVATLAAVMFWMSLKRDILSFSRK